MYYESAPIAMNFAGIGFIIGHEITHGFDHRGSTFDEKGKMLNWWKNETREKFEERVECFKQQYSQYTEPVTGKKLNGSLTVGDDIADNGGLKQAYTAYKIYAATTDQSMDLKLPSKMYRFTKDQLFFISYANVS
ncbi:neprilysin-like protein [Leptotrombidium deliense]|uniref:Neprilysin-like protein n=1 Tax=Leptotrombidium deliense TaxID=299467 RepID=A0A443RT57_9ACAR|nr:neprilysin-like protein [Leptotrombidium deliense]